MAVVGCDHNCGMHSDLNIGNLHIENMTDSDFQPLWEALCGRWTDAHAHEAITILSLSNESSHF
jgi:hypothetical protein